MYVGTTFSGEHVYSGGQIERIYKKEKEKIILTRTNEVKRRALDMH